MTQANRLLNRLEAIGQALERSGRALALIGLGSVGRELERLDEYSDLDFFVIVEPGHKAVLLDDLGWLSAVSPIAYHFKNTPDGHKLLFADGIFCEFAVFEPDELREIPFAPGRIVWKRPDVDDALALPHLPTNAPPERSLEWLLGEALTNLYVGLSRHRRGEKLSATRFIQGYAVDRVVELAQRVESERPARRDPFAGERRFEQRFHDVARELPNFMRGYDCNVESARAILAFLVRHFNVHPAMRQAILALCAEPADGASPPAPRLSETGYGTP